MHMYYSNVYVTEIVEQLRLDISDLTQWVFGADGTGTSKQCWAYRKIHRPPSSAVSYEKVKPIIMKSTEFKLLNRIRASVDDMEKNSDTMDMDDMSKAMGIVERLDKITRLEEGKATAITETTRKTYTLRDIGDMRSNDDSIEDAEYKDVDNSAIRNREWRRAALSNTEETESSSPSTDGDEGDRSEGDSGSKA